MPPPTDHLAYLTQDAPGIGGVIKQRPEDFLVEEQPLYQPTGNGEHLYLYVEKRGRTTSDAVRRIARSFRVGQRLVSYAGLKDKHAVTRQHFSVHMPDRSGDEEGLARLRDADPTHIIPLWSERHENKLRRGHLAGNRFVIRIRNVQPTSVVHAKRTLDRLVASGAPNYVGEQRFGYRGENQIVGRLLLTQRWQELLDTMLGRPRETDYEATRLGREAYERGDYDAALRVWPFHLRHERQALDALRQGKPPRDAVLVMDRNQRGFFVSAVQSEIFNSVLDRRIRGGLFDRLIEGDLAWKHDARAVFTVDAAIAAHENGPEGRVPRLEVSPTGPMWGAGMMKPSGAVLAAEEAALAAVGLSEADLEGGDHASAEGSRRPMRNAIINADVSAGVDEHGAYVRLAFDLPRGAFATAILREIMKSSGYGKADDEEGG